MPNRPITAAMLCATLASTVCLSGCGHTMHAIEGSGTPAHSSSPVSTGSPDSVATPTASVALPPQAKHLLQAPDLPAGARIQPLTQLATEQAAQAVEGAAPPVPETTTKPACTKIVNSGAAVHPVDPNLLAGEAIAFPGVVLTEVIVPRSIAIAGIRLGQRQQRACVDVTLTETVNGVTVTARPQFRTGPHHGLILASVLTSPGKRTLYETRTVELAGQVGIAFSSQSTTAIQPATINDYLNRAATRAAE